MLCVSPKFPRSAIFIPDPLHVLCLRESERFPEKIASFSSYATRHNNPLCKTELTHSLSLLFQKWLNFWEKRDWLGNWTSGRIFSAAKMAMQLLCSRHGRNVQRTGGKKETSFSATFFREKCVCDLAEKIARLTCPPPFSTLFKVYSNEAIVQYLLGKSAYIYGNKKHFLIVELVNWRTENENSIQFLTVFHSVCKHFLWGKFHAVHTIKEEDMRH